jgi:hypothetical protein
MSGQSFSNINKNATVLFQKNWKLNMANLYIVGEATNM